MIKISTLYKKNPENLGRVINEINPENEWVFKGEGVATRKFDGTAAAIINGELYKRYDVKKGRQVPEGAIPCQDPDEESSLKYCCSRVILRILDQLRHPRQRFTKGSRIPM